jgi:1-acyl-sn-glycerol-3-phosphate acyltransferase
MRWWWQTLGIPFRTLATGLSFLYFGVGGLLLSRIILPLVRWRTLPGERLERCQEVVGRGLFGFWAVMHYTRALRFLPPRWHHQLPPGPLVIVANHPTLIDVTAIWAACGRVNAVVQPYMVRHPLTRNLLGYTDQIPGPDGTLAGAKAVLDRMEASLRQGRRVLVFPEGTRSPERGLHPFKRGAFEVACRTGAPVLPILLRMEPPVLSKGAPWYRTPRVRPVYSMLSLPPVDPAGWGGDSAAMAADFEAFYRRAVAGEAPLVGYAATIGRGACDPAQVHVA